MGKPYSDDLRRPLVAAMEGGMSCYQAGRLFGVAPSTAGNWHRRYKAEQSFAARAMGGDRRSKLLDEVDRIKAFLAMQANATLWDVRDDLGAAGIDVSYMSVQRLVQSQGLRFKKNTVCD